MSPQFSWFGLEGFVSKRSVLERSILIERVRAGMARAKAEGKRIGRPVRVIDLEEILRLRVQGFSIRQIARRVGAPSSTVAKRLQSRSVHLTVSSGGRGEA